MTARYPVHKMIQDLMKDKRQAAEFQKDPEAVFEAYGLTTDEKSLLRQGSLAALHTLGVHPNLQMKYARLRAVIGAPGGGGSPGGPIAAYLDRLLEH